MVPPRFSFRDADNLVDPELATELESHMQHMGAGRDYLRVKAWPPHKVGIEQIEAYLDILADEHWHPDVLLVDYPKLFKFRSAETLRIELGYAVEDLRRIAQERNMAVVMVHQAEPQGRQRATGRANPHLRGLVYRANGRLRSELQRHRERGEVWHGAPAC